MSKFSEILKSPAIRNNRALMGIVFASCIGIFGVVTLSSQVYLAYDHQTQVEQESMKMRDTIKKLSEEAESINKQEYRPVEEKQVPNVQSDLMLALQSHQLKLDDLHAISAGGSKKVKHKTFEMKFSGSYDQTIAFLQNFHARDSLISIFKLNMKPESGKGTISTDLVYRIYVK